MDVGGAEELINKQQLVQLIAPLPQYSYHFLGYVRHIDACLTSLLYWQRRRGGEVDDRKDEKDSRDYVVSAHFC
jgi:hypothetical protein